MEPSAGRRGGRGIGLIVAAGLALLAAGAALTGSSLAGVKASVDGVERPVAAGARDPADQRANNSPSLARNPARPDNLVVVNRIDLPQYSCAVHSSTDNGASWTERALPFPAGEERPERCFAPDASFGPDGTLYVAFATLIGMGNSPNAEWTVSSRDDGASFSVPARVLGPHGFQVRLLADPQRPGRLYLSWLQAESVGLALFPTTNNPITVARSDDGGATWGPPARVSRPSRLRVVAPSMAFGRGGELLVLYVDLGDDRLDYNGGHGWLAGEPYGGTWSLVLARSGDQGATWSERVVDGAVAPTERFLVFLPQTPSLAVDPARNRVYVGFADGRLGDPDVWVRASTDGGATFSKRRRVNDTARSDGRSQYLPRLSVAGNGRLDVLYYDRRSDAANVRNEVSLQSSFDGGRSFEPRLRLTSVSFDSRIGFGSSRGLPDLGSRLALLSGDGRALAVWTDTRAGTVETRKQDLGQAAVAFTAASPWRQPLRRAAPVLVIVAVVVLIWSLLPLVPRGRPKAFNESEGHV
ncbi:MAG: sialidase family protein [Acidimicrobiales bacterium]